MEVLLSIRNIIIIIVIIIAAAAAIHKMK